MAEQLAERIGPSPRGVKYPVWAWHTHQGKRGIDLRFSGHRERGVHCVRLTLDIPAREVLLSDFMAWNIVLNYGDVPEDMHEDSESEELSFEEIRATWPRVLLLGEPRGEALPDVQAVFWGFSLSQVLDVKEFVAK